MTDLPTWWHCLTCGATGPERLGNTPDSGNAAAHTRNTNHPTESTTRPDRAKAWADTSNTSDTNV